MAPRTSFIIVAQNEADWLPATLKSIHRQETSIPYEIIVVDGASTDQTPAIARDLGAQVIESNGNGIGYGRNQGAEYACGERLAFIDADTRIVDQYLETMLAFVEAHGLVGATSRWKFTERRGMRARLVEATHPLFAHHNPPILYGFPRWNFRSVV